MKITEAYNQYINVLNRYSTSSVEDFEFSDLFNVAQLSILKDQTYNHHKGRNGVSQMYGWEMTQYMNERWFPLIHIYEGESDGDGKVMYSDIKSKLGDREIYHFDGVLVGEEENYARWTRHNDLGRVIRNYFKKPTLENPIYLGYKDYIQIRPKGNHEVTATIMVYPREVVLDFDDESNNVDPELTDAVVLDVIYRILQLQGISIREQQLFEMANVEEEKQ